MLLAALLGKCGYVSKNVESWMNSKSVTLETRPVNRIVFGDKCYKTSATRQVLQVHSGA